MYNKQESPETPILHGRFPPIHKQYEAKSRYPRIPQVCIPSSPYRRFSPSPPFPESAVRSPVPPVPVHSGFPAPSYSFFRTHSPPLSAHSRLPAHPPVPLRPSRSEAPPFSQTPAIPPPEKQLPDKEPHPCHNRFPQGPLP